jgi:hypothetical protein
VLLFSSQELGETRPSTLLLSVSDVSPGPWRRTQRKASSRAAAMTTGQCMGRYHLVFRRASCPKARICTAKPTTANRLSSVRSRPSPPRPAHQRIARCSLDISQCDHSEKFSRAWSCGLKKTCDRRSTQSRSASTAVDYSFVHRIREHYPTPQLQHRRPAPIGKTRVLIIYPCAHASSLATDVRSI